MDLSVTVHDPTACFEDGCSLLTYDFKFDDRPIIIESQGSNTHTWERGIGGVIFIPPNGFIEIE